MIRNDLIIHVIDNILESFRKYKDKQLEDIEKLDQIESMLPYLG